MHKLLITIQRGNTVAAAIIMIIIIWICMWGFYKFMYPRAPKSMMPKDGDVTTPRICDFCGNSLAEYRGVLETNVTHTATAVNAGHTATTQNVEAELTKDNDLFFCNYEHQADFHAGKTYR